MQMHTICQKLLFQMLETQRIKCIKKLLKMRILYLKLYKYHNIIKVGCKEPF